MRQRLGQRQSLVGVGQGSLRGPQHPEGRSGKASADNTRVLAHTEHPCTALVWRVAGDGCLQVLARSGGTRQGRTTSRPEESGR